jgi:hypothetical protein
MTTMSKTETSASGMRSQIDRKTHSNVIRWEVDPLDVDRVARALNGHHRVTLCEVCGCGPRIHSKIRPASKCLRCGNYQLTESVMPSATKQRCRRCKTYRWQVLKSPYCESCREKVAADRAAFLGAGKIQAHVRGGSQTPA